MVGRRVPSEPTFDDSLSYITSVKNAFHDEPSKYEEFIKLLNDFRAQRFDAISAIARVEELMKEHPKLLLGFNVFLPPQAKITIPPKTKITIIPKAKRTIPPEVVKHAESNYTKRKRSEYDGASFFNKLKTRFQSIDTHVVKSFHEIIEMLKEGNMSVREMHEEVVDLLYYHEDLIAEFSRFFPEE